MVNELVLKIAFSFNNRKYTRLDNQREMSLRSSRSTIKRRNAPQQAAAEECNKPQQADTEQFNKAHQVVHKRQQEAT